MANNFLRFKLLMLSRASSQEIYTAAREIFGTLRAYPKAKLADALNTQARMSGAFAARASADIADTIKREAIIEGETEVKCGTDVAITQGTVIDITGEMESEGFATLYGGINTGSKVFIDIDFDCSAKLLRQEFHPVISQKGKLTFDVGANAADLIKVAVEQISKELPVKAAHKLAGSRVTGAHITGETEVKCGTDVATPIRYEIRSTTSSDTEIVFKLSASLDTLVKGVIHTETACKPTMYGRTRLSDFSSQRLSDLQGKRISDLKYKEINL